MAKCGSCGERGKTAAHVKACYAAKRESTSTSRHLAEVATKMRETAEVQRREREEAEHVARFKMAQDAGMVQGGTLQRGFSAQDSTATEKQRDYLASLLRSVARLEGWDQKRLDLNLEGTRQLTKSAATKRIDEMKGRKERAERFNGSNSNRVTQHPVTSPLPDVPAGHYAIKSLTGTNDLDFFRVDRPTEGRWVGKTYVKRVIGGKPDVNIRFSQYPDVLNAIIEAGVKESALLYGKTIGRCTRCNRHLTDQTSRDFGMGPDCRGAVGW